MPAVSYGSRLSDVAEFLAVYEAQLRGHIPDRQPQGARVERDGPVLRISGLQDRGFVVYRSLGGVVGAELDALIARQVQVFRERGEGFEWKLHGHDRPADLPRRLRAAGFVPEAEETVMIAPTSRIAGTPHLPDGVTLRRATGRRDLDRIAALEQTVWNENHTWLAESLQAERQADPAAIAIVIAEAGHTVVCAGWLRFESGTEFATLWGGATLPRWRGRGIYRATVVQRANLAAQGRCSFLEVDASADSRPILERLGFTEVTTTTPYVWSPPNISDGDVRASTEPGQAPC